jgi:hypothetical protein
MYPKLSPHTLLGKEQDASLIRCNLIKPEIVTRLLNKRDKALKKSRKSAN